MSIKIDEKLEKERLEKERLEKERLEKERLEKERLERKRLEQERLEQERLNRVSCFSDSELEQLSSEGFIAYQKAKQTNLSEDWYLAGCQYDVTYKGMWGDLLFCGVEIMNLERMYNPWSALPSFAMDEKEAQEEFKENLSLCRKKFVVCCEFFLKAIELEPKHYMANLQLATALTAGLQIMASPTYWLTAMRLDSKTTQVCLQADLMAKYHRGNATRTVVAAMSGDKNLIQSALNNTFNESFKEQTIIAQKMLESSPYIRSKIKEFNYFNNR